MSETGRTIVITGASIGFGAAAVRAFADRGDRVWATMRDAEGRNAAKKAAKKAELEAYSQSLRYEVAPFGIDVALVEPGPFPSNLLAAGKPPVREDVLASYGDLGQMPATMIAGFAQMLASEAAPDPQLVVDACLALADAGSGKRPTRTVVGITRELDEMNAFTQPRQDALLKEMQLDAVLGGADA